MLPKTCKNFDRLAIILEVYTIDVSGTLAVMKQQDIDSPGASEVQNQGWIRIAGASISQFHRVLQVILKFYFNCPQKRASKLKHIFTQVSACKFLTDISMCNFTLL